MRRSLPAPVPRFGVGDITGRDGLAFWAKTRKVTRKWPAAEAKNGMS